MHKSKINSLWLHTALDVAVSGSPRRSAARLGINITTVYRHIDALEKSLDVQLFVRQNNGWVPAESASVLLETGKKIEQLLRHAEDEVKGFSRQLDGHLRIAVSDDFAAYYVAAHLKTFCHCHDWLVPELIVSPRFSDLANDEADVAIRPDMNPGDTLVGQRVCTMKHALYASRDYLERFGCPALISDLDQHQICGYGGALKGYNAREWMDRHISSEAIIARFGNVTAMVEAVARGTGLGLFPCYIGDTQPDLALAMTIKGGLPIDIWLVTASAARQRAKVQAFFKFFAAQIRADARQFEGKPYTGTGRG